MSVQDIMMDHPLRTISYIADIGNIVVLMARRRMPRPDGPDSAEEAEPAQEEKRQYKMICHVFESEDVSLLTVTPLSLSLSLFLALTFKHDNWERLCPYWV